MFSAMWSLRSTSMLWLRIVASGFPVRWRTGTASSFSSIASMGKDDIEGTTPRSSSFPNVSDHLEVVCVLGETRSIFFPGEFPAIWTLLGHSLRYHLSFVSHTISTIPRAKSCRVAPFTQVLELCRSNPFLREHTRRRGKCLFSDASSSTYFTAMENVSSVGTCNVDRCPSWWRYMKSALMLPKSSVFLLRKMFLPLICSSCSRCSRPGLSPG